MANNRIAIMADGASRYSGNAAGLAVKASDKVLYLNVDGNQRAVAASRLMSTGAGNLTLTAADNGAIVQFNDSTSRIVSLPSTQAGLRFTFIIQTVTGGAGHKIDPTSADKITGNGLALADGVAIECDGGTDRAGDSLVLVGDGVDGWFVESVVGTWSSE